MAGGWHEEYKKKYKELKEAGKSFFPHTVFKDTLAALFILALLSFLAWHFGAGLEEPADPTDTTYNPRPEWYFLFMFQALKFFPGHLEAIAAVVFPGAAITVLILLPFLDRGPRRHIVDRKALTGLGIAALAGIAYLTWAGYKSPLTNPIVEKDPNVMAGMRLYRQLNCAYCHRIGGKGGGIGPELDKATAEETEEWLEKHFRDPQSVSPGSAMPKLNLLDDEIHALVAYMKSFGAGPYTKEAPKLFVENCAACHRIETEGADTGPDLSLIGSARDKAYIKKYIEDPSTLNPDSAMPGYKGQMTETQIEDLARYLSSLGR
ncbi:MAG: c-type cytochrome [Elusimicrobia bacterium]|nr:c-type cytochrome [Elusimicrobiota bacterium]